MLRPAQEGDDVAPHCQAAQAFLSHQEDIVPSPYTPDRQHLHSEPHLGSVEEVMQLDEHEEDLELGEQDENQQADQDLESDAEAEDAQSDQEDEDMESDGEAQDEDLESDAEAEDSQSDEEEVIRRNEDSDIDLAVWWDTVEEDLAVYCDAVATLETEVMTLLHTLNAIESLPTPPYS